MPTLNDISNAFIASRDVIDAATISRITYWTDLLGHLDLTEITPDDVDDGLAQLINRGKLKPLPNGQTIPTGEPLAPSTVNRYVSQMGSLYKYARKIGAIRRSVDFPTKGIERGSEKPDPNGFFSETELETLITFTRVYDTKWGKMETLIVLAVHTGMRKSNLLHLKWSDVDLVARTAVVERTKNGDSHTAPLSTKAVTMLRSLPQDGEYIFRDRKKDKPYSIRRLWETIIHACRFSNHKTFHMLRHSSGYLLAKAGENQATIMKMMGHRTLTASARYMHSTTQDKLDVADRVFG